MSVGSKSETLRLVMKATTTWWFVPIGSVRQTAGRSFDAERSSNGNGTSTTLPRVVEGLAISGVVEIRFVAQEIEGRIFRRGPQPRAFVHVIFRTVFREW